MLSFVTSFKRVFKFWGRGDINSNYHQPILSLTAADMQWLSFFSKTGDQAVFSSACIFVVFQNKAI
jgi:hypothetical protein